MFNSSIATAARKIWSYMEQIRFYDTFVASVSKLPALTGKTLLLVGDEHGPTVEATLRGEQPARPPQWGDYATRLSRGTRRIINKIT